VSWRGAYSHGGGRSLEPERQKKPFSPRVRTAPHPFPALRRLPQHPPHALRSFAAFRTLSCTHGVHAAPINSADLPLLSTPEAAGTRGVASRGLVGVGGTAHGRTQVALSCARALGLGFGSAAGRAPETGGAQGGPRYVERLSRASTIHKLGLQCATRRAWADRCAATNLPGANGTCERGKSGRTRWAKPWQCGSARPRRVWLRG
jgi:hypothetical protein